MPLVHINIGFGRRAHGFFSVGLISSGVFSLGLLSAGVFSLGCLSAGLVTLGALAFGGLALGAIALGLIAFGGVAMGLIAFGGLALGLFSCGGCSVGLFAVGGYADGYYVAVGDVAHAKLAFGDKRNLRRIEGGRVAVYGRLAALLAGVCAVVQTLCRKIYGVKIESGRRIYCAARLYRLLSCIYRVGGNAENRFAVNLQSARLVELYSHGLTAQYCNVFSFFNVLALENFGKNHQRFQLTRAVH